MFTRDDLEAARALVRPHVPPTPQHRWPQLEARLGAPVWLKHENHGPVGAFKLRGGLVYFDALLRREPGLREVLSATRGNHGQSVAFAAARHGLRATIVVPHGNSLEKNAAMRALGAELVEHGADFQAAREHAQALAAQRGAHMVPSFHPDLVRGVATYWMEFFEAAQPEVVYVPIGLGSGICACAAARAATGAGSRIVGVVSAHAPAYLHSFEAGRPVEAPVSTVLADGMACRVPEPAALAIIRREVEQIVAVTDDEVAAAMRLLFAATHNVAEGAGAAALAAALQQRTRRAARSIGLALTGGNVDSEVFARVLAGG
ncbi:MAG: threonine dehydratase [Piscinibacter sp.]|uniref:threonine dehydratase n=1 Tax=Piscinibacter sp. TaxID=1903157 RepID=UPI0025843B7B|nr:threonine dehydratase [Piscinibacter sp.]MCW5667758.1 threonine dehydratase [Piscinibacter sp.]